MRHVCLVCNYVYDSEQGDPVARVAPGTSFEDLPAGWCCPECGAQKEMFEAEDAQPGATA